MEIFDAPEKSHLPNENVFGEAIEEKTVLRDRFVEPPFTVLNANGGEWLKRKRAWGRLGIKSELGRDGFDTYGSSITKLKAKLDGPTVKVEGGAYDKPRNRKEMSNISIFDPVVCELMYRWFCPEGGEILDCFAGGSVRGIVAKYLGFNYCGVDLSAKQIEANRINAEEIFGDGPKPNWFIGDSERVLASSPNGGLFDLVFSCPPYAMLEVYSNDPNDLSNMTYNQFLVKYRAIIAQSVRLLKRGGYAAFVVGEVRDRTREGSPYFNFVGDTVSAFMDAGADYYNEAILVTAYGTAMLRTKAFTKNRKMVKVHQNILVFRKP